MEVMQLWLKVNCHHIIINLYLKLKNKTSTNESNIVEVKDIFKDENVSLSDTDLFPIDDLKIKDEKKYKNREKEIMKFKPRP